MRLKKDFKILKGKIIKKIEVKEFEIVFICEDNTKYIMFHEQSCCEGVEVEEIIGKTKNIIGYKVLNARKETSSSNKPIHKLWTFYIIETRRGTVTIRWVGQSNGYYSIEVDFAEVV